MKKDCFGGPGQWYKGNLHSHTTNSDGHRSPVPWVQQNCTSSGIEAFFSFSAASSCSAAGSLGGCTSQLEASTPGNKMKSSRSNSARRSV